ncbi:1944_t:CDS:2, partial [Racocetra persica]
TKKGESDIEVIRADNDSRTTKLTSGNQHLMLIKGYCSVGKSNKTAEEIKILCHSD